MYLANEIFSRAAISNGDGTQVSEDDNYYGKLSETTIEYRTRRAFSEAFSKTPTFLT